MYRTTGEASRGAGRNTVPVSMKIMKISDIARGDVMGPGHLWPAICMKLRPWMKTLGHGEQS